MFGNVVKLVCCNCTLLCVQAESISSYICTKKLDSCADARCLVLHFTACERKLFFSLFVFDQICIASQVMFGVSGVLNSTAGLLLESDSINV